MESSTRRRSSSQSQWSAWSSWSTCSLTCGQGTKTRNRVCVGRVSGKLERREALHCNGGRDTEHFLCRLAECAPGEKDPRAYQCTLRDDQPVQGKTYEWAPYNGTNQCELTCMGIGFNFYYNFGKVLDGTPCRTTAPIAGGGATVCLNGNCATAGCDGRVGSSAVYDHCHVCGGRNTTCLHYKGAYLVENANKGYTRIATIPKGASHVVIRDNSSNTLALQDDDSVYIVNGNDTLSPSGNYRVGGVKFMYDRQGEQETILAAGQLTENVTLLVLSRQPNPGVYFEYYITRNDSVNETSDVNVTVTPLRRHYMFLFSGASRQTFRKPPLNRRRTTPGRDASRNTRKNRRRFQPRQKIPATTGRRAPNGRSRSGNSHPQSKSAMLPTPLAGNLQPRNGRLREPSAHGRNLENTTHPSTERRTGKGDNYPSTYVDGSKRNSTSIGSRNAGAENSARRNAGGDTRGSSDIPSPPSLLQDRSGRSRNDPRTRGVRVYVVDGEEPATRERLPQPGPQRRPGVYSRQKRLHEGNSRTNNRKDDDKAGPPYTETTRTRSDMAINQDYWSQMSNGGNAPNGRPSDTKQETWGNTNTGRRDNWGTGARQNINRYDGRPNKAGSGYDMTSHNRDRATHPAGNTLAKPNIVRPWTLPERVPPYPTIHRPTYPQHPQSIPNTHPKLPLTPRPYHGQPPVRWYPTLPPSYTLLPATTSTEHPRPPTVQPRSQRADKQSSDVYAAKGKGRRRKGNAKRYRKNKKTRANATWKNRRTLPSPGHCVLCKKVSSRQKNYCRSDFVVRAYIVGFEYIGNETRYELRIVQSYKNTMALFNQEFVWAPDRCHCPRLKVNGEYVVMGTLVSDSYTRESRLQIDRDAFVRKYNESNHRRVSKLQNTTKRSCKKFS